jgi:LDH2 family malate/lactate/ureidoglycolate dehydrogenase
MSKRPPVRLIPAADLERFTARSFVACGMPEADARKVAVLMIQSDLRGTDGHGIFRLPQYCKRIRDGGINLKPNIRIVSERKAQALIDGDNAMGHLVVARAAEVAIAKASEAGVAWVGIRGGNHAGCAAVYAKMPLAHDMIGLYIAMGNANHVPPWGGTEMLLSTNPIAIAVPSGRRPPIVLDMATTTAAYGKVKLALQRGEEMPVGWMIDRDGRPLTDPGRASEGFLLPIGGAKGYGLALMFGLLAGTLNGAKFGRALVDFNADRATPTNTGQLIVAVDIAAFMDVAAFKREVDRVWSEMKSSPTMPGFDEVRLPGERSAEIEAERARDGIPVGPELARQIDRLAEELDVRPL